MSAQEHSKSNYLLRRFRPQIRLSWRIASVTPTTVWEWLDIWHGPRIPSLCQVPAFVNVEIHPGFFLPLSRSLSVPNLRFSSRRVVGYHELTVENRSKSFSKPPGRLRTVKRWSWIDPTGLFFFFGINLLDWPITHWVTVGRWMQVPRGL